MFSQVFTQPTHSSSQRLPTAHVFDIALEWHTERERSITFGFIPNLLVMLSHSSFRHYLFCPFITWCRREHSKQKPSWRRGCGREKLHSVRRKRGKEREKTFSSAESLFSQSRSLQFLFTPRWLATLAIDLLSERVQCTYRHLFSSKESARWIFFIRCLGQYVVVTVGGGGYREIIQKEGGKVRKREKKIYVWDKFRCVCVCLVLKKSSRIFAEGGGQKYSN